MDRNVILTLTLLVSEAEADEVLADVGAHRRRDKTDGHRDHGMVNLDTQDILTVVRSEVLT